MAWENNPNPAGYPKTWPSDRRRRLNMDRAICQVKYDGCTKRATEVDHIDGDVWALDSTGHIPMEQLRSVCQSCHRKITAENGQKARNLPNPRQAPESPAILKEAEAKNDEFVDDLPSDDESTWFTSFGPVFEKLETGKWRMPKHSLGPYIVLWSLKNLRIKGEPFKFTNEQVRILFWMYSLDENGRWDYNRVLHIAPKGWGKDPFGAALCAIELCGPARFSKWDERGRPVPKRQHKAWVQIAGVNMKQNRNTWAYLEEIFSPEAVQRYGIEVLRETIYAKTLGSHIESVSSGSRGLEGNFPTFVMVSEAQHWLQSTGHHRLYDVLRRNLTKVDNSHMYITTNAYDPNEDSIAQRQFENYEEYKAGRRKNPKLLPIFLGASHKAPFETEAQRLKVLNKVYGSAAKYTNLTQFIEKFDDGSEPINDCLRFYYNKIGIESMSFIDIRNWDACVHPEYIEEVGIPRGSKILLFGDMSKNDDATVVVGIVVEGKLAGCIFKVGVWERPTYLKPEEFWQAPREEVDAAVVEAHANYRVIGFWADPSHKMDEQGGGSYWMPIINEWHRRYSRKYVSTMWANGQKHSTNFDMTIHANQKAFVEALGAFEQEVTDKTIRHSGDADVRRHLQNARRFKSKRFGETIAKEAPRSKKKIDLAVGAVGAYLMLTVYMTARRTKTQQMRGYRPPERDR